MNLYQISTDYLRIAQQLTDGEVTPELETELAISEAQLQDKGRSYGYVVLSLESEVETIDAELKRLTALKQSRTKAIDRLKSTLSNAMQLFQVSEIKTPTLKINFRKSKSIEIINEDQISEKYIVTKTTSTISKTAIRADIELGVEVLGAVLVENSNIQIK